MGFLDKLRQVFKRSDAMQSVSERSESIQSSTAVEIEPESLQLGIAAGYTGKSLRGIEDSLNFEVLAKFDERFRLIQTLLQSILSIIAEQSKFARTSKFNQSLVTTWL